MLMPITITGNQMKSVNILRTYNRLLNQFKLAVVLGTDNIKRILRRQFCEIDASTLRRHALTYSISSSILMRTRFKVQILITLP